MIRHGWIAAVSSLWICSGAACAGTLQGTAELQPPPRGQARVRPEDAVVWLEKIPERTERDLTRKAGARDRRKPPPVTRLRVSNVQFDPRVAVVPVGGSLVIRNEDRVWHGLFSVSPTHAFELGKRAPGRADTLTFDKPGQVQVRCDIHPDMSATVLVTPNHAFARADGAGHWQLPKVPKGDYVLRAWAPGQRELRRDVQVPARGTVSVALRW